MKRSDGFIESKLHTCFLILVALVLSGCSQHVRLAVGRDASAGDVPCYIVSTPTATYYLEQEGGGLSSMLDKDGVDWLGFHKDPGTESRGEYRGFPNAIHKQDGSYFHARNAGTDLSDSRVDIDRGKHVRIVFTSGNGNWVGRWDFYADRCVFTMDEVSPGYRYWVLYEGVPRGELDKADFWISSKDSARHSIDEKQNDDLPDPEWIAFGDPTSPRILFLLQHEGDTHPDRYYNMRDEMTVFGFGRAGGDKFLYTPTSFSIGFIESTDYQTVAESVTAFLDE